MPSLCGSQPCRRLQRVTTFLSPVQIHKLEVRVLRAKDPTANGRMVVSSRKNEGQKCRPPALNFDALRWRRKIRRQWKRNCRDIVLRQMHRTTSLKVCVGGGWTIQVDPWECRGFKISSFFFHGSESSSDTVGLQLGVPGVSLPHVQVLYTEVS